MPDDGVHAVVEAFDVHSNDAVEVFFGRALDGADMRDSSVVNEDVNALAAEKLLESGFHLRLVGHIAEVGGGGAAGGSDSLAGRGRSGFIYVQNANHRAVRRELSTQWPAQCHCRRP